MKYPNAGQRTLIQFRYRIGDSYGYGVYTMRPDGSDARFVAPITGPDATRPVWSPDGFEGTPVPYEKVSKWAIKAARWDGTEIIRLGIWGIISQLSKDGNSIVYLTGQSLFEEPGRLGQAGSIERV